MANFVLDVFGTKVARIAVLMINVDGGWDIIGGGHNTGGSWEWIHGEDTGYFIWLTDNKKIDFGHVDAAWDPLPNPNGYPPKPFRCNFGVTSKMLVTEMLWRSRKKPT